MSISNQTSATANPATKYIRFKNGQFQYWDKIKEENISIDLPFSFTVLDELACVTGWDDSTNSGIYSNEVKRTTDSALVVKSKGGKIAEGLYADIKDSIKSQGGKYTASIYAMHDGSIVNIKLSGSSLGAWINKDFKAEGVVVDSTEEMKKGSIKFSVPVFNSRDLDEKELSAAKALDSGLQEYLNPGTQEMASVKDFEEMKPVEDLPF